MSRWMLLIAIVASGAAHAQPASTGSGQAYPAKAVRLVVGFSAGGPTDLPARFIADRLGTALGQRVVVENRAGASGQIAAQDVLSKPRDGYNLLLCTHFEAINAAVQRSVPYKLSDIAPISQVSRYYYGVVVTNEIPATDWESFIRYAQANPGKLNYGTIGRGSAQEILALEIAKLAGIRMTGVPYKGGAEVMNDLIAGRVQFYASPTLGVLPQYRAGKLRLLAVTSAERIAAAPEIPTVSEKGLPFVRYGWLGICAGSGTPRPIIARLNREIVQIAASPAYRDMIEKAGSVPVSSTPEELGKVLEETYEQTERVAREFDLKVD